MVLVCRRNLRKHTHTHKNITQMVWMCLLWGNRTNHSTTAASWHSVKKQSAPRRRWNLQTMQSMSEVRSFSSLLQYTCRCGSWCSHCKARRMEYFVRVFQRFAIILHPVLQVLDLQPLSGSWEVMFHNRRNTSASNTPTFHTTILFPAVAQNYKAVVHGTGLRPLLSGQYVTYSHSPLCLRQYFEFSPVWTGKIASQETEMGQWREGCLEWWSAKSQILIGIVTPVL